MKFEGENFKEKKWNEKGYNINNSIAYELKDGKGNIKEFNNLGKLIFDGELLNGEKFGKGKEYNYNGCGGELKNWGKYE